MKKTTENPITSGPIGQGLLAYFFPIFVGSMFQQLYNAVDAIIVGRFVGTAALAAVGGSSGQVSGTIIWMLGGISSGASVTISQHYGAKGFQNVHKDIHNGVLLSILLSFLFAMIGLLTCRPLFIAMKTPADILEDSLTYIRIIFTGLTVSFLFNIGSGVLRALGDSKRPLYYLVICCVLNIGLDLLFVIIFEMGVRGVAIATVMSQIISAVLILLRLMRKLPDEYRLKIRKLRLYKDSTRAQLRIGLPSGLQSALYGIANIIIQSAFNSLGTATVAANSAYGKLDSVFWLVNGAFGTAVTTYVGQNFGAGKLHRVKKSTFLTLLFDGLASVAISVTFIVFSEPLLRLFTEDPEVIQNGKIILQAIAPYYFAYVCIEIFSGSLRGLGNVAFPTVLTLGGVCAFRLLWIYLVLPKHMDLTTLAFVFPASWILTGAMFVIYFILYFRKFQRKYQNNMNQDV